MAQKKKGDLTYFKENFYLKGYGRERGKRAKKVLQSPRWTLEDHVSGPVGRTDGPKKNPFRGGNLIMGDLTYFKKKFLS